LGWLLSVTLGAGGALAAGEASSVTTPEKVDLRVWPATALVGMESTVGATLAEFRRLLAERETATVRFTVTGDVTDRTETALAVWGFSFPPSRDANVFGAVMGQEGNLVVQNFAANGLAGGRFYRGEHYLVEKRAGKNGFGAEVPVYVFGDAPAELVALREKVAAMASQVAAYRAERDSRIATIAARLAPLATEVRAVQVALNALDGTNTVRPAVTTRDAVTSVIDGVAERQQRAQAEAPALQDRLAAVRAQLADVATAADGLPPADEHVRGAISGAELAGQRLALVKAHGSAPLIAHHRALLSTLPESADTVRDLGLLGRQLAVDRIAHPKAWPAGLIADAYQSWWDARVRALGESVGGQAITEEDLAGVLATLAQQDPDSLSSGAYRRLIEAMEDRLGARMLAGIPAGALGTINPWTETRAIGLSPETRRHHRAVMDRANRATTGAELVALASALAADRQAHPQHWAEADRLLGTYAILQARQFDTFRRRPTLVEAFQAVNVAFAAAEQARWDRPTTRAFNDAAVRLDPQDVATMNALIDGAALGPGNLPASPGLWQRAAFAQALAAGKGHASPTWIGTWQAVSAAGMTGEAAAHHRALLKRVIDARTLDAVRALPQTLADDERAAPAVWADRSAVLRLYASAQTGMVQTWIRVNGTPLMAALNAFDGRDRDPARTQWQAAIADIPAAEAISMAALLAGDGAVDRTAFSAWSTSWPAANHLPARITTPAFWSTIARAATDRKTP